MQDEVSHVELPSGGLFFLERDGARVAKMSYRRLDSSHVRIEHTLVDPALRGQGMARRLLDAAVAWARRNDTRLSASCSYVVAQFARDASLRDVHD